MNVSIDRRNCTSCGTCWETCPAFFEESTEDHLSQVIKKYRTEEDNAKGTSPEDLDACVTEAADLCPVQVITAA